MSDPFPITVEQQPDPADVRAIAERIREYNLQFTEDYNYQPLAVFARDAQGELIGGLTGATAWHWLVIDYLWVRQEKRFGGLGSQMLAAAEAEARRRGCHHVMVDTITFQAPDFYRKHGYVQWGQLDHIPPPDYSRLFFMKDLSEMPA